MTSIGYLRSSTCKVTIRNHGLYEQTRITTGDRYSTDQPGIYFKMEKGLKNDK